MIPIKVYSKTDLHAIRKLVREETYKWISGQTDKDILQAILRGFEMHNIVLSEFEKKSLTDLIGDGKKWDSEKVKKETRSFVKSVIEVIRGILLDTLPESCVPTKREEFDEKLYEESKKKVAALGDKLLAARERANQDAKMLELAIGHIHEMQLELINKQVEQIWKSNEEEMPEHFALKELQLIHSEMVAERHLQELALKRQEDIEGIISEIGVNSL